MQATMRAKQFRFGRVGVAAIAVGALASATLGLATLAWTGEDAPRIAVPAPSSGVADVVSMEQNTQLPDGTMGRVAIDRASYADWEANTQLPGTTGAVVRSVEETRYAEQNVWLPTEGESLSMVAPEHRQERTANF